jgi:DNA-binding beta-propeller fold protein YncE
MFSPAMRPLLLALLLAAALAPPLSADGGRATLVVGEGLNEPFSVDFDESGRMYIVEMGGHRISVLEPGGALRVVAGTGEKGLAGDDGEAAMAQFNGPHHLLVGPDGRLYVADTFNNVVRRIDLRTGIVTRVAGTGQKGFSGDGGPAVDAQFSGIFSIAVHEGALYVCDLGNRRIRRVDLQTGIVTTVAGSGEKGIPLDGAETCTSASGPAMRCASSMPVAASGRWPARERPDSRAMADRHDRRS